MKTMDKKTIEYLNNNSIVNDFINKVNIQRQDYYVKSDMQSQYQPIVAELGQKYIRLWAGTGCWGFISRVDGDLKGSPIKKGDLLKCATWKAPAKHSRGNIIDGTARYGIYGPDYL